MITIVCDRSKHTLSFEINGVDLGVAYAGIDPNVENFYFCISMYVSNQAVEIEDL